MQVNKRHSVFVAGHRGMVGQAVVRNLRKHGYTHLILKTHAELDLTQADPVQAFFDANQPDAVVVCAAKVGGILANASDPVGFLQANALISLHTLSAAARVGVRRLIYLGSSCIYPKHTAQPMSESALLTGALEPTNEAYALAKIMGAKLCEYYRRQDGLDFYALMPTNLYGFEDNFDLESSHVIPALIRKVLTARALGERTVSMWGDGSPRREFLHVDDLADSIHFVLEAKELPEDPPLLNVGWGSDVGLRELMELIAQAADWPVQIEFDLSKPNGTPRKLLDTKRMRGLGWTPKVQLLDGLRDIIQRLEEVGMPQTWATQACRKET